MTTDFLFTGSVADLDPDLQRLLDREDKRQDYGEERLVCFGLLEADVVVMVYTERPKGPHVISLRKAEKHEARYYRQVAKENLG